MFSSHTKEWHAVFNGTKEEGRKAIRSLFGPNNKWGYDATGKPFFLWNPLKASSGTVRTRIVQSLDAPSCEGQFLYSKFQNFSQPKYKIFLVDLPANSLWQTLRDEFPEAKVILVVRDDQKWINSLQNHLVVSFYYGYFSLRENFVRMYPENRQWCHLRLNDNSSGKCGSTVVSVQSTDGFSITAQKQ